MPKLSDRLARIEDLLPPSETAGASENVIRELRGLVAAEYGSDVAFRANPEDVLLLARIAVHAERFEQVMLHAFRHMDTCPHVAASA